MQNETLIEDEHEMKKVITYLSELMAREVAVLREMLSNMRQEQEAILNNDTDYLKQVTHERELIMDAMFKLREERIRVIRKLTNTPEGKDLEIEETATFEHPELLSFKDQIITILDKLKDQASRNSYLLENKVAFTKNLIYRLHPDESKQSYQGDGSYGTKVKTTTITLVNHEV